MNDAIVPNGQELVALSVDIAAAYVTHNALSSADLPKLVIDIHAALKSLGEPKAPEVPEPAAPAVSIRKSITPDFLICLEDGKKFKSLKRHLRVTYAMSPNDYRAKWKLPADYPMVAPNYSATRSAMARANGLGLKPVVVVPVRKPRKAKAPAEVTS